MSQPQAKTHAFGPEAPMHKYWCLVNRELYGQQMLLGGDAGAQDYCQLVLHSSTVRYGTQLVLEPTAKVLEFADKTTV